MKIAVYPGSFNPWHKGHDDVLKKALKTFDRVVVAQGRNPEKDPNQDYFVLNFYDRVDVMTYEGLFVDFVKENKFDAVIKGIRNFQDLEYERAQQYWNEDLGLDIPVFYVISDRELTHISSSAMRMIKKSKGDE